MAFTKELTRLVVFTYICLVVEGCGRLKCYQCNSQDSPSTCGEKNFNADAHKDTTVSGSTLVNSWNGGTSCIRGYAINDKGTYYYRDKSNAALWDGCKTPQVCACSEDLCNSKGSRGVYVTSTFLFCYLATVVVQKMTF
ncbi:uncharacterized protein LOC132714371 [Ruditapes philippinarum]|uniref:uncharacterized protein LOC132714371 n=1 Tax=Ruditapes philippinarum TaxID=129788 RepID=UPI00295B5DE3|nr:uncharacterized protein LOC132714371 [Ruditapes philippinarum]